MCVRVCVWVYEDVCEGVRECERVCECEAGETGRKRTRGRKRVYVGECVSV